MGSDLKVDDLVKVLEGPHKGQTATVRAVYSDLDYPYHLEFAVGFGTYKRYEIRKLES